MKRRTFLGWSGTAAGVALLQGCAKREAALIEQNLKRSSANPGEAAWRRSICQQCQGGCEITVRTIDGRAKKIEGEPTSVVNRGGVCALGHSALQELYLPGRVLSPVRRSRSAAPAGAEFELATWEEALAEIGPMLRAASSQGRVAICCGPDPIEHALVTRLASGLKATVTVVEPPHAAIERRAWELAYGKNQLPLQDLSGADLVLAAGASILDRWGNPVAQARAVADMQARGGLLVATGERMSLTTAKADIWLPTSGGLASLFHALTGKMRSGSRDDEALARVAREIGCPLDRVEALATALSAARAPKVLIGGEGQSVRDVVAGLELAATCGATANVVDADALLGSQSLAEAAPSTESTGTGARQVSMETLAESLRQGSVSVVVGVGVDLLAAAPQSWKMGSAFAGEDTHLVAISTTPDATATAADFVLPMQTDLERVQLTLGAYGEGGTAGLALADPVVEARGEARHGIDILLALTQAASLSGPSWSDASAAREAIVSEVVDLGDRSARSVTRAALRTGGRVALKPGIEHEPIWHEGANEVLEEIAEPDREGTAVNTATRNSTGESDLRVVLFEGVRGEGSAWGRDWLNELPDPMSSVMWDSWIELAPVDAAAAGVETGDAVVITSEVATMVTTAFVQPAMRPGTAAMPVGGFDVSLENGGDPRNLLGMEAEAGAPAQSFRARLERARSEQDGAPVFGRGLKTAEQIPAGWKSQKVGAGANLVDLRIQGEAVGVGRSEDDQ